ncbi:penicillin-binding protein 1A [Sphaerotilus microaerophilus]|uniref:Penicillin-binding protein 1A n=1 Tax=Sphaerotilus microaerophilus TaxID=2914710 RepID=A0ABN6PR84_9BURK|nr:PBP1A family penicillin-binding protein [Sphaerotilus sp. FB-5]BDI05606.1 penicillin-binding protein 1A [Sphaerotilus sp. FB-5]
MAVAWRRLQADPRARRAAIVLGSLAAGSLLLLGVAAAAILPQLPSLDQVINYQPRQPLQVVTRDGVEIAQFGSERRQFIPVAQIPQRMKDAVIAVEDARFYEHHGVDPVGLGRAAWAALTGGMRQGASTITQQVARNFFLSSRRTVERKLKEVMLALRIEQQLSKDQILELYLNQIYLGHRSYGFGAAAQAYFGKPLDRLSIAESAMLAGLPQNPAYANPITNLERATNRQRVVLQRMLVTGKITQAEHDAARAEKLVIRPRQATSVHAEYVAEMARRSVFERYGERAYTEGFKVTTSLIAADQQAAWAALRRGILDHDRRQAWRGPEDQEDLSADAGPGSAAVAQALKDHRDDEELRVAIVLQASPKEISAQLATGEVISITGDGLRWVQAALAPKATKPLAITRGAILRVVLQGAKGGKAATGTAAQVPAWSVSQWPQVQGGLVSLDPATGRVRALVGGFDFTRQPFNHVTQAWRQPGSSFKPFLYSAVLEHGIMPATLINDAPLENADVEGAWNPQNYDGEFAGPLTLRQALARSKNLVSIRLLRHIGLTQALGWVSRFGFDAAKQPDNLTLALGAGSTTPMQMAGAFAVLANGGFKVDPLVIERITDVQGRVVYEAPPAPPLSEELRVLPARNVFLTNQLLQEVTRSGTAARAQGALRRPDLYGKTGTTNDSVDAWFAGFQPSVAAVVWLGYDEPRSLGAKETGGGLALPIWISYMDRALRGVPVASMPVPDGVTDSGGDWLYSEYVSGGFVRSIGMDTAADAAAEAASAPSAGLPASAVPLAPPAASGH